MCMYMYMCISVSLLGPFKVVLDHSPVAFFLLMWYKECHKTSKSLYYYSTTLIPLF